jgi:hypothetical protein
VVVGRGFQFLQDFRACETDATCPQFAAPNGYLNALLNALPPLGFRHVQIKRLVAVSTLVGRHAAPTGSKFLPPLLLFWRHDYRVSPCRSKFPPCTLRHDPIKCLQHEFCVSFRRRVESARSKTYEWVWEVLERPEARIAEDFARTTEPSASHLPTSSYICWRSTLPAALLQIRADDRVNCSDYLLPMLHDPVMQLLNFESVGASVLRTFKLCVEADQQEARGKITRHVQRVAIRDDHSPCADLDLFVGSEHPPLKATARDGRGERRRIKPPSGRDVIQEQAAISLQQEGDDLFPLLIEISAE